MRLFSYRNRVKIRKILVTAAIVLGILLLGSWGILSYLDRYIVYDHDGAHLRTQMQTQQQPTLQQPTLQPEISYLDADTDSLGSTSRKLSGYYVTRSMLKDLEPLQQALQEQNYYAVLFDLKDIAGNFYYTTEIAGASYASDVDHSAVDALIDQLKRQGVYLIARIPAFADWNYGLNHPEYGLPRSDGSLWMDENNCYWLNPASSGTISYLESICAELQARGFQEIVFDDFRFPDSEAIVFDESAQTRQQALSTAAQTLDADLSALDLKVSFAPQPDLPFLFAPQSGRLYFSLDDGSAIASLLALQTDVIQNSATQVVFLTESRDTRFDDYGHLSPAIPTS